MAFQPVPLDQVDGTRNEFFLPVPVDYRDAGVVVVPAPPTTGDFTLNSEDGVLSWVAVTP